jgi:hypothetical protein
MPMKKLQHIRVTAFREEKQKVPRCENNSKIQSKNRRKYAKLIPLDAHIHGHSLSWLDTGASIKRDGIRIRISKKNGQHKGQKKKYKRTNNDQQYIHTYI